MFPFLLIQILRIYLLVPKSGILYFLGYTIFTNTKVENIHRQTIHQYQSQEYDKQTIKA